MIQVKENPIIQGFSVTDLRFPTSRDAHGSDAINRLPDYSNPYLTLHTSSGVVAHGASFTLGRGNELVCQAIQTIGDDVLHGLSLQEVLDDWVGFHRKIEHAAQIRWCGPSSGVIHMACVALSNAIVDLWCRVEGKPFWKILCALSNDELLSLVDFQYLGHLLTREEAMAILNQSESGANDRIQEMRTHGLPAYFTLGWIGYPADKLRALCHEAVAAGWTAIKVKIGEPDPEEDNRRLELVREAVGPDVAVMVDSNQVFGVQDAIARMELLRHHNLDWFEEPTSPYSASGHEEIRNGLEPMGIRVATGENCQNLVVAAEFIGRQAVHVWQLDSARVSIGENIGSMLLAKKNNVTVCPHAGGSGLCVMVPHIAALNYARISPSFDRLYVEYCDIVGDNFEVPAKIESGRYLLPEEPGYLVGATKEALAKYRFPYGSEWYTS